MLWFRWRIQYQRHTCDIAVSRRGLLRVRSRRIDLPPATGMASRVTPSTPLSSHRPVSSPLYPLHLNYLVQRSASDATPIAFIIDRFASVRISVSGCGGGSSVTDNPRHQPTAGEFDLGVKRRLQVYTIPLRYDFRGVGPTKAWLWLTTSSYRFVMTYYITFDVEE